MGIRKVSRSNRRQRQGCATCRPVPHAPEGGRARTAVCGASHPAKRLPVPGGIDARQHAFSPPFHLLRVPLRPERSRAKAPALRLAASYTPGLCAFTLRRPTSGPYPTVRDRNAAHRPRRDEGIRRPPAAPPGLCVQRGALLRNECGGVPSARWIGGRAIGTGRRSRGVPGAGNSVAPAGTLTRRWARGERGGSLSSRPAQCRLVAST